MDTLFLFSKHLNDQGCFSCSLNAEGSLVAPLAQRTFAEIRKLQEHCETVVVETSEHASLLTLELPWLPDRKARIAIPYALEEKLAQNVDELHFAFDKAHYQNNQYLVVVISKERMHFLMQLLTTEEIKFQAITLDWFALQAEELCINEASVLAYMPDFKGALTGEMAELYLKKNQFTHPPLLFSDSQSPEDLQVTRSNDSSFTWLAQRLLKNKAMNLCQGEMQHGNQSSLIKQGYQLAGLLFCVWLLSIIIINGVNLYFLNKETAKIDSQIAVIYHQFFPEAKQVISPKFRISQLLKGASNDEQNRFWYLLNHFAKLTDNAQFTVEQMRYQNKVLSVNFVSPDFAALEKLEKELKKIGLQVKQTQASTREQNVIATLELS